MIMVLGLNEGIRVSNQSFKHLDMSDTCFIALYLSFIFVAPWGGARSSVCNVYDTESKEQGPALSELITVEILQKKRVYKNQFRLCHLYQKIIPGNINTIIIKLELSEVSEISQVDMCFVLLLSICFPGSTIIRKYCVCFSSDRLVMCSL